MRRRAPVSIAPRSRGSSCSSRPDSPGRHSLPPSDLAGFRAEVASRPTAQELRRDLELELEERTQQRLTGLVEEEQTKMRSLFAQQLADLSRRVEAEALEAVEAAEAALEAEKQRGREAAEAHAAQLQALAAQHEATVGREVALAQRQEHGQLERALQAAREVHAAALAASEARHRKDADAAQQELDGMRDVYVRTTTQIQEALERFLQQRQQKVEDALRDEVGLSSASLLVRILSPWAGGSLAASPPHSLIPSRRVGPILR